MQHCTRTPAAKMTSLALPTISLPPSTEPGRLSATWIADCLRPSFGSNQVEQKKLGMTISRTYVEFLSALFCCVGDHGCRESSPRSMNDVISKSNIKVQGILQAKQTGINLRCPLIRIIGCIKVEHQEVKTNALMVDPPLVDVKKMEPCSPSFGDLLHCTTKKEQRAVGGACVKNATSDGSTFCSNNDPFCNSLATCSLICVSPYNPAESRKTSDHCSRYTTQKCCKCQFG